MPICDEEIRPKVEKLSSYTCEQALRYSGPCGEIADYRLSVPGLSLTMCAAHAQPYMIGKTSLRVLKCRNRECGNVCKPGTYIYDSANEWTFCSESCRGFLLAPTLEGRNY